MGDTSALLNQQDEVIAIATSIVERLVQNARDAQRYWSLWEALNNRLTTGTKLSEALAWHVPKGLGDVRRAMVEAAIHAVLRATENPRGDDSLSACRLTSVLGNEDVLAALTSADWSPNEGSKLPSGLREYEQTQQLIRISWFIDHVPAGWGRGYSPPEKGDLSRLRSALRDVRNRHLAHSVAGRFDAPLVDDIRAAVALTVEIAQVASLIFLGHTSGLEVDERENVARNDEFWHYFECGLVSAFADWDRASKQRTTESEADKAQR